MLQSSINIINCFSLSIKDTAISDNKMYFVYKLDNLYSDLSNYICYRDLYLLHSILKTFSKQDLYI